MSRHRSARQLRRVRLLVRVLLAVVVFISAPTVAQAAFLSAATAPVTVGTYKVPAPTTITATPRCNASGLLGLNRILHVTIDDFTAVPRATAYVVTLTATNGSTKTVTLHASTRSVTIESDAGPRSTNYKLRVVALVGNWTGAPIERPFTC